jgi:peptidylprolyl isomerase
MSILRLCLSLIGLALAVALVGCGPAPSPATPTAAPDTSPVVPTPVPTIAPTSSSAGTAGSEESVVTTASGLQYIEIAPGSGEAPNKGDVVSVHYRGTLDDGTVFDNSYDRGQPIQFALGRAMVIAGWDEGIAMMRQGGKAKLIIPPSLGYGAAGAGGVIPPNATLTFEVELVNIQPGPPEAPTQVDDEQYTTTDSGLKYYDFVVGEGAEAVVGKTAVVHYTGWLTDGTMFDSSLNRSQTFPFMIGAGRVIKGWEEGVVGMRIGGKRQLVIPASLGYGAAGAGGVIPPNATLIFEVELVDVR